MAGTFTRFQAALLGCGLAATSCLITASSHRAMPQQNAMTLPERLGPWKLLRREDLHESELSILQATNHWRSVYQYGETGQTVIVTLVAGASGPLASHHPQICYSRKEFSSYGDAGQWTVPERNDTFRFQTFEPRQFERPSLTIAYAWYDGDRWRAPVVPRIQLAGHPVLQRLQFTMRHHSGMTRDMRNIMQNFVELAVNATDAVPS